MAIPRDPTLEAGPDLLREGYEFIPDRCRRLQSDAFETRLMFRRVVCISGVEAARIFYEPGRFTRRGAIPQTALRSLQDKGSVATLDGADHRHRKAMFLGIMTPAAVERMADAFEGEWRARLRQWSRRSSVIFFDEMTAILTRSVCAWAGVPLGEREAAARTGEFAAMIDGAGAVGPRNWRGLWLRRRTEKWARSAIEEIRAGRLAPPEGSPAKIIAEHGDQTGALLPIQIAAVELINILRPTVAVDRFITFSALALHDHPALRATLAAASDEEVESFVQEVRRFYPFFPAVGGRALESFTWRGHRFSPGDWVLLDLYGTNHDPRLWEEPQSFRPERFLGRAPGAFDLIPQGGGDYSTNHRCPGEWITIALMKRAVGLLTSAMRYEVPPQDLRVPLNRLPTRPKSGFVLSNVEAMG